MQIVVSVTKFMEIMYVDRLRRMKTNIIGLNFSIRRTIQTWHLFFGAVVFGPQKSHTKNVRTLVWKRIRDQNNDRDL